MPAPIVFDKERVHLNVARIKKGGENFEVVIEPDLAIDFRNGKISDIHEVLHSENVFSDAKKGERASEALMKQLFGTDDALKVAEKILREGEIQVTEEYRENQREIKRKSIISVIARNAVDPRTGLPHPADRIERAMEEAKVKIDYAKGTDEQIKSIVASLQPILPIKFEKVIIELRIPAKHAARAYAVVKGHEIVLADWMPDGSLSAKLKMPAGLQEKFFDELNKIAHGDFTSKVERE
ncbi:MAG: ribosome assembly factor SBDS [Candidatus Woesearchaeota archaeon]|nr:ribosome assembly factor SBDS [Candidatus Woesearchaeota archaeon]